MRYPKILIGTMLKNSGGWLSKYWEEVKKLDYPKDKLRIVFVYGDSKDNTLKIAKRIVKEKVCNVEIYKEPNDTLLKRGGAQLSASVYNDWKTLLNEDYFMLLDSDLIELPSNLITELLKVKEDIVAPYPWSEGHRHFYDSWIFRIGNKRFHPMNPPGLGLKVPIEVDSVGTCFLATRESYKSTPITNPYPNLSFCNNARRMGYKVIALPYLEVFHADIEKLGIIHNPLPPKLGGYPEQGFITFLDDIKTLSSFKKHDYKNEFKIIENDIKRLSLERYKTSPIYRSKGEKWSYNKTHYDTLWMTQNPYLVNLLYKVAPIPSYIEVEVTTKCNLRCKMCEHTYWKEPSIDMTFKQFKYIIDQFPNLKWIGLTGIGESFINKDFMKMLEYVKSKDIYVELYDTFFFINENKARKIIELGVDRIFASIDATTKETYESLRVGSNYDRVWKNVKKFNDLKKEMNCTHYPELCFHYITCKDNIHEVLDYLDLLYNLNIDVHFVQYARMLHKYKETRDMFTEVPETIQNRILKKGNELGINVLWNANLPKTKPPLHTCTAWYMPFIFVTGDVISCCAENEQNDREWQKAVSLGNIFEKPFKEIWYDKKYRNMRKKLKKGICPKECRNCPVYKV